MILPPDQMMKPHVATGEMAGLYLGAFLGSAAILAGLANAWVYVRGGPTLEKTPGGKRGALSSAILGILVGSYFVWVSMIFILPQVRRAAVETQKKDLKSYLGANMGDVDPQLFLRYVRVGAVGIDEDIDNGSALTNYLQEGDHEAAKQLLAAGAHVNAHGDGQESPLLTAIDEDDPAAVRFLLRSHADPNLAADNVPIFDAVNPDPDVIPPTPDHPYTADDGDNPKPRDFTTHHRVEIVEALVEAGADLNVRDDRTYTPLMIAAATGQCDMVAALLEGHPDQSLRAGTGETALAWARQEHPECSSLLLGTKNSEALAAHLLASRKVEPAGISASVRENREARKNQRAAMAQNKAEAEAQEHRNRPLGFLTGPAWSLLLSLVLSTLLYMVHRIRSFIRGDKQPVHWQWVAVSSSSSTSMGEDTDDSAGNGPASSGGKSGGGGASRTF